MNNTAINKINEKLKSLPDRHEKDILTFISYLNLKDRGEDWSQNLSEQDLKWIEKGSSDVANGRTYSHTDAMSIIDKYIAEKRT